MFGFLNRCRKSMVRHHRRVATARQLAALDDEQLKDIGIGRSQIWAATGGVDPRQNASAGL